MVRKIAIDMIMTVLLLFLMARQITGDLAHEWLGAGMFVLWIVHHILNRNWYSHLFKGKYTPARIIQIIINAALFLSMLGLMVSGVILSRKVFAFLPISGGVAFARSLHIVSAFWGFVPMAFHLGLHWNMILGMMRNAVGVPSGPMRMALFCGVYVHYGPVCFSGTLYFQRDSKTDREEEEICGDLLMQFIEKSGDIDFVVN